MGRLPPPRPVLFVRVSVGVRILGAQRADVLREHRRQPPPFRTGELYRDRTLAVAVGVRLRAGALPRQPHFRRVHQLVVIVGRHEVRPHRRAAHAIEVRLLVWPHHLVAAGARPPRLLDAPVLRPKLRAARVGAAARLRRVGQRAPHRTLLLSARSIVVHDVPVRKFLLEELAVPTTHLPPRRARHRIAHDERLAAEDHRFKVGDAQLRVATDLMRRHRRIVAGSGGGGGGRRFGRAVGSFRRARALHRRRRRVRLRRRHVRERPHRAARPDEAELLPHPQLFLLGLLEAGGRGGDDLRRRRVVPHTVGRPVILRL